MKEFFHSIRALVAVSTAFVACTKEVDIQDPVTSGPEMKTITVKTDFGGTRTTLDSNHQNLVWSAGDELSIFNDVDNQLYKATYPDGGGDLTVEVPANTQEIYAHYPHWASNTNGPESVSVYVNPNQTQTNPGELNGSNYPMVAKGTVTADDKAIISLYPVASALALNIYHAGLQGAESVESVTVTPSSSNTGFIGRQTTNLKGDHIQYTEAGASSPITVTLTNALALGSDRPTDAQKFAGQIYVCLAKQSYAHVTFEIKTNKGTYTITSSDTPFDCVANDFVPVNINLAKAAFQASETSVDPTAYSWALVEDALAIGDKVVIANNEYSVAMSIVQNNNNRGQTGILLSNGYLTANADVQMFEVVSGKKSNTFAFKCLNGNQAGKYLAAASSSGNYLRSVASVNDNASWSVSISDQSAYVLAQGDFTHNKMQYNPGSSIFSCYESQSYTQKPISFYRAGLPYANLSFPEQSYQVNVGDLFTAPELTNPFNVPVTYSSSNSDVAAVDPSTGAVTIGTTAGIVTITASFGGNSSCLADEASYDIIVIDPNADFWVKTNIGSLSANDVFVIVGDDGYALPHDKGASAAPSAIPVTVTNNVIVSSVSDNIKWNVSGNATDGYVFYPNGNNSKWLYCTDSNSGVRVGTNENKLFTIDENGYLVNTATSRYISVYNDQDWRCYVNTNNNPQVIDFYVKVSGDTGNGIITSVSSANVSSSAATLSATFGWVNAQQNPQEAWFMVGTNAGSLTKKVNTTDILAGPDGSFSAEVSSLEANTTYYFKAYMTVWNGSTYVDIESSMIGSFTTAARTAMAYHSNWLELPALQGDEDYFGYFYGSGGNTDDNRNYSYNYSYSKFASLWTAYQLKYEHKSGSASTSGWSYNPAIPEDYQINITGSSYPSMYGASDYSRGHQCPNGDRKSDDQMNAQTYYSTNQTPQIQNGFNGDIWSALEGAVRNLVTSTGDVVYVITGPAYRKVGGNEAITYLTGASGKNAHPTSLPVPNYYWKALLKVKWNGDTIESASAIGFWFEHKVYDNNNYQSCTISVDQIETWTGFDLFANLPDGIESTAETNTSWTSFQSF